MADMIHRLDRLDRGGGGVLPCSHRGACRERQTQRPLLCPCQRFCGNPDPRLHSWAAKTYGDQLCRPLPMQPPPSCQLVAPSAVSLPPTRHSQVERTCRRNVRLSIAPRPMEGQSNQSLQLRIDGASRRTRAGRHEPQPARLQYREETASEPSLLSSFWRQQIHAMIRRTTKLMGRKLVPVPGIPVPVGARSLKQQFEYHMG